MAEGQVGFAVTVVGPLCGRCVSQALEAGNLVLECFFQGAVIQSCGDRKQELIQDFADGEARAGVKRHLHKHYPDLYSTQLLV